MQSNRVLRDTVDQVTSQNEIHMNEVYHLQMENRDLRDRIEILESVIGSTSSKSEYDQIDWRDLIMSAEDISSNKKVLPKTSNIAINEMATELIETKKANRQLLEEIENLKGQIEEGNR